MKVFRDVSEFREWRRESGVAGRKSPSIGLVPTMGALHSAHGSLIERARAENDLVVVTVFVNPAQFNDPADLEKYPRTLAADIDRAEEAGADVVFAPDEPAMLYPDGYRYQVAEKEFSRELCGAHRPGHFEGVLTVVLKLLNLVRPTRAYFGEKDFQQLELIRGMAEAFFLETKIVACPTLREEDGLAMSSRNRRLDAEQRKAAPEIYRAMITLADAKSAREALQKKGFAVDYCEDRSMPDGSRRRFVAASLGEVRLIDNVRLEVESDDKECL